MSTVAAGKNDRLNCRISPGVKQQVEAAARALGLSITAFTETALAEKAQTVLAEQERVVLSDAQFSRFVQILEDKAPPTARLQSAMMEYQSVKAAHPERGL